MIHPDDENVPPPLTLENLKALIKSSFEDRAVIFRPHARYRSKERKISHKDVQHICAHGCFRIPPRYENHNWKYELTGEDLDEVETIVVVAVDNTTSIVTVVTCY